MNAQPVEDRMADCQILDEAPATFLDGCRVALFKNAFEGKPQEIELMTILAAISSCHWGKMVEWLREIRARSVDEYTVKKRCLPAFTMSSTASARKQLLTHSGLLQIDFDKLDDGLDAKRQVLKADPHVAFGYVSPSGVGLKLGLRIDPERHAESFAAAKVYFLERYGITIDPAVSDQTRLCFVSADPDLWINPRAIPLPLPEAAPAEEEPVPESPVKSEAEPSPAPPVQSEPAPAPPVQPSADAGPLPSDLELKAALSRLVADDYSLWLKVGMALKDWDAARGLELWETWSKTSAKYEPGACARKWESFSGANSEGETVTARSVLALARQADDELAARLARLDPATYDRVRDEEARRAGVRTSVLDTLVNAKRGTADTAKEPQPIPPDPQPWEEPVNGVQLLDSITTTIKRFLVLPPKVPEVLALWVLHSYTVGETTYTPILALISPTKRCGKSVTLELLAKLARRPLLTSNATPAALYRAIERWHPTLLIDEFDSHSRDEAQAALRNILNSGFHREGVSLRCQGDNHDVRGFATFCPKVVASIGDLPDTVMDRAIIVRMRRKLKSEVTERFRKFDCPDLRRQCARWAADNKPLLKDLKEPKIPKQLNDRQQDIWEPLFAIAILAGGSWIKTVEAAALALCGEESDEGISTTLLKDIGSVFAEAQTDRMSTSDLIDKLCALEERPWATFVKGQPLTPHRLGRLLKPYGIASATIRIGDQTPKGFCRDSFQEAWDRYLDGDNPFQAESTDAAAPDQPDAGSGSAVEEGELEL